MPDSILDVIAAIAAAWQQVDDTTVDRSGFPMSAAAELDTAVRAGKRLLPGADLVSGLLPWEIDPDLDPEPGSDAGHVPALFDVVYHHQAWCRPAPVTVHAHHLADLAGAVACLITWHPGYDANTGRIITAPAGT
jgi:hypothetical protein